mmetsp:Transcript_14227/g.21889  ORF Transcript_14227/g.21889 Transcript_14227/m.21889 type:complete len:1025 (-) Transcript_14227:284-3358(-)|eukprot:CAMPEP_0196805308 /NCGR_PEP_ID=MMETSP1362-20130617/5083_1 /TAXON_ID=163516 /ORGANISM="Leptocylindrus danicus, Strain CCMP1856" /LENGTH=1024 /DNA_ID=CAMNT_0042178163 /DNA_START=80 /DNA_END=3154 /DNA_ORIENTATION=+
MGLCQSKDDVAVPISGGQQYHNGGGNTYNVRDEHNTRQPSNSGGAPPRLESCDEQISADIGKARVRYAYLSQRGYYPDEQNKANQDAYSIVHDFTGVENDAHFAVYDGHGRDGDRCAQFAKENLPSQMEKYIRIARAQHGPNPPQDAYHNACIRAHIACNTAMHESKKVDDSLSGTTAISIAFHSGSKFTVCNVGDSRAIVGQEQNTNNSNSHNNSNGHSSYRAFPLSRDQTPYRRDERARVRQSGARILSLDQLEGLEPISDDWGDVNLGEEIDEGGDPPRVWSPHGEYPGTAFTRSLGDMVAEELGVYAEPEILSRDLVAQDKIIVIASDGVFEFLTNQSVIDMCAKFNDPLEACKAVVAEAYELWLQYELRTDDITMICIFIDSLDDAMTIDKVNVYPEIERSMTEGSKPVRTQMSKEKTKQVKQSSRNIVEDPADTEFNIDDLITLKTDEEKASIAEAIKASVIFQNITEDQREMIFGVMEPINVKKGDWIIKQGEFGDRFYVVDSGRFEVRIANEDKSVDNNNGGNLVHVYVGDGMAHPSFGELALMYSAPRAASIIAQTDGKLWALHRVVFKKILAEKSDRQGLRRVLRKVCARNGLRSDLIGKVAELVKEVTFEEGDVISKQGDSAESFYVITQGTCDFSVRFGSSKEYASLSTGDFFGEKALLSEGYYDETVIATNSVKCLVLHRPDIIRSVGSMSQKTGSSAFGIGDLKRYGAVQRDEFGVTILAKEGRNVYTLKVLAKNSVIESGEQKAVIDEVRLLRMMTKSICIPVIKGTYQDHSFLYVLFEEAVACNLETIIQDPQNSLDENMAKHIVMCCLDALEIIHSKGVIYNGISSDSLLVSHDGYVLLNNFRFSKESKDSNTHNTICGPAHYRSPEIVQQQGFGIASDFWALGVLIFECITGQTPFATFSNYEDEVCEKIIQHQFGSIRLPMVGTGCRTIVNKLLNPDPLDRLGTAGARSVKKDPWFSGLSALSKHRELSSSAKRHLKTALAGKDATSELPIHHDMEDPNMWKNFY